MVVELGLTVVDDKVYQLTWRSRTGYIFDKSTLEMQSLFDSELPMQFQNQQTQPGTMKEMPVADSI